MDHIFLCLRLTSRGLLSTGMANVCHIARSSCQCHCGNAALPPVPTVAVPSGTTAAVAITESTVAAAEDVAGGGGGGGGADETEGSGGGVEGDDDSAGGGDKDDSDGSTPGLAMGSVVSIGCGSPTPAPATTAGASVVSVEWLVEASPARVEQLPGEGGVEVVFSSTRFELLSREGMMEELLIPVDVVGGTG